MPEYALRCPRHATSPRVAREFVASVLRAQQLGAFLDDAALCISELVTNACVHAGGTDAALRLVTADTGVRITVYDEDTTLPVLRNGYDCESGRGLWILDAVTEGRWGTEPGARFGLTGTGTGGGSGKAVWFELGSPSVLPS